MVNSTETSISKPPEKSNSKSSRILPTKSSLGSASPAVLLANDKHMVYRASDDKHLGYINDQVIQDTPNVLDNSSTDGVKFLRTHSG